MRLMHLFSFGNRERRAVAKALYDSLMATALDPAPFEAGFAVDTFEGRFEHVSLLSAVLLRRLRREGAAGQTLAEDVYKLVFSGFDYAYRETGVGDSSISRKVRGLGETFFGFATNLDNALNADEGAALAAFIQRNGLGGRAPAALEAYLRDLDTNLTNQTGADLLRGKINWPLVHK